MSPSASTHALEAYGWNRRVESLFGEHARAGLTAGRVLVEYRGAYVVATESGERMASVSGRFRHDAFDAEDFPAVGDWVALSGADGDGATIHAVLPRHSRFARQTRGDVPGAQVVAANVDLVLLVNALDGDFNLRRLERYLALAWSSGAEPVVVLNKADLCEEVGERLAAVQAVAAGVPIRVMSALEGSGIDGVLPLLEPGRTVALLGSSGVGKSTIVNAIVGHRRQAIRDVRADDQRGRHTTTVRELLLTPSGALLIDSPGMRAVGMWEAEEGLETAFADVEELAAACRFSDCRHDGEPGCAVTEAIATGSLSPERLASRRKLERELAALKRRRASTGRAELRRNGRRMERFVRSHMRAKYGEDVA